MARAPLSRDLSLLARGSDCKLGDLYKKKTMFREALSRYWSALALKNDDPYIHRSVLEIYKILSEHEKEQLKTLEGQNSFARNP